MGNKNLKNYWFWVLVVVLAGGFFLFFKVDLPVSPVGGPADQFGQSYLVLDFGNNISRKFQGSVAADMTLLEAIYSASIGGDFDFRYIADDGGLVAVSKIDEAVNLTGGPNWHFYLNGALVDQAVLGKVKIKAGDRIEARYK